MDVVQEMKMAIRKVDQYRRLLETAAFYAGRLRAIHQVLNIDEAIAEMEDGDDVYEALEKLIIPCFESVDDLTNLGKDLLRTMQTLSMDDCNEFVDPPVIDQLFMAMMQTVVETPELKRLLARKEYEAFVTLVCKTGFTEPVNKRQRV